MPQSSCLHPVCQALLESRGITDVDSFLNPPRLSCPSLLPGVAKAATRIREAIDGDQRIIIHGDYDADGCTGSSILMLALKDMGANVNYFVPSRTDGYGLSNQNALTLSRLCELIITVDCGIQNNASIDIAQESGHCDVIVTDHHEMGETLPNAHTIVHPALDGYEHPYLCGAAVAFRLVHHLFNTAAGVYFSTLKKCAALAAYGTVADVMPLTGENRTIVMRGLPCTPLVPAAHGLLDSAGTIRASDIAFKLGPRLNAIGRLDDARHGVALLLGDESKVQWAIDLNDKRKEETKRIVEEAMCQAEGQEGAIVVSGDWNPGISGVAAGRLAQELNLPTVIICNGIDSCTGSVRSAGGINVNEIVQACSDLLIKGGGHAFAAGLSILKENIGEFRKRFQEEVRKQKFVDERQNVDMDLPVERATLELARDLDRLEPFGKGFPAPLFRCTAVVKQAEELKSNTLKLHLFGGQSLIGFNMADKYVLKRGEEVEICYSLGVSEWQGRERAELQIKSLEAVQ